MLLEQRLEAGQHAAISALDFRANGLD